MHEQNRFHAEKFVKSIYDINSRIYDMVNKEESMLLSYDISYGQVIPSTLTVSVTVTAVPREFKEGSKAYLQVGEKIVPMTNKNTSFTGTTLVSVFQHSEARIVLEYGDIKKTEVLPQEIYPGTNFLLKIDGKVDGSISYNDNVLNINGNIELVTIKNNNDIMRMTPVAEIDGKIVDKTGDGSVSYKTGDGSMSRSPLQGARET